ncbi:putative phosphoesterase [Halorubrum aquaticum]|uniref:Putative phosphoesterase n=1 Tax=Halorubrum aquaticum TaxID=387340 RepID=A0A1I3A296_9EURY|nr:metallophosphoesterase [Halorubrum aquaticum]SFH44020.1 putative phosphoesterase [Halorubrum aquaticum]
MATVEPVVGEPAAVADLGGERALLVADVHAGIEVGLRYERGVELESRADERRDRLCSLIDGTGVDRLVVLGDLAHRVGAPEGEEREELAALVSAVTERVPLTLVEGNHDAGVADAFADDVDVIEPGGGRLGTGIETGHGETEGGIAVLHGHTRPDPSLRSAEVVCMGHEHPQVRLEDAVGGSRTERAWLRGPLKPSVFGDGDAGDGSGTESSPPSSGPELVVFPAFNERSGGTWINVEGGSFLAPFLPEGLAAGDAYLLDGTRLGDFRRV